MKLLEKLVIEYNIRAAILSRMGLETIRDFDARVGSASIQRAWARTSFRGLRTPAPECWTYT